METEQPTCTTEESKEIKVLEKESVHRICSGQVVLSLAIAVKELVENSLDAGASLIEVKLKRQGLDSIEVVDNGSGVAENNFIGLSKDPSNALKITDFLYFKLSEFVNDYIGRKCKSTEEVIISLKRITTLLAEQAQYRLIVLEIIVAFLLNLLQHDLRLFDSNYYFKLNLAAKHYTSKLREFEDLRSVDTFGFRGEALSSLCALCEVVVTTRHNSVAIGSKLEFDHYGKIKQQTKCARTIGTTVSLTNIFGTLPVRQRELSKNIKTEFNKICQILRAYCLVAKGCRIICTNQNNKAIWQTFLCTRGSDSIIKNIEDVYGAKQIQDLMEIKQPISTGDEEEQLAELEDLNNSLNTSKTKVEMVDLEKFKIEGWISSCDHGRGSKLKDKQYFYVNSRPCDPKQVIKAVNEVYHRYNNREYPFVYLNIITPKCDVDVNLTPDKRQLLVNNEKILILAIKLALSKTFKHVQSTFKADDTIHKLTPKSTTQFEENGDDNLVSSQEKFKEVLSRWKATGSTESYRPMKNDCKRKQPDEITVQKLKLSKIQKYLESNCVSSNSTDAQSAAENREELTRHWRSLSPDPEPQSENQIDLFEKNNLHESADVTTESLDSSIDMEQVRAVIENSNKDSCPVTISKEQQSPLPEMEDDLNFDLVYDDEDAHKEDDDKTFGEIRRTIRISIEDIEQSLKKEVELKQTHNETVKLSRLKFKTEINPSKNKTAEDELDRGITKDLFTKMDIIGQFNLGFIIAKLDDDLFIIDQHATDEMYNFEMLQRSTRLQFQKLAVPQTLEFTTVNEMILMDNLDVFKANGFEFEINNDAQATRRVKLISKPFSKNWEFGKNDIDELIFMLHDAPPNTMCRPSRVRSMFASRACRKSVMIGTALKQSTMRQLLNHMGEVDKPWNCPHGRPTMRHLVNLEMLRDNT